MDIFKEAFRETNIIGIDKYFDKLDMRGTS